MRRDNSDYAEDPANTAACIGVRLATGALVHQPNEIVISPSTGARGHVAGATVCAAGGECRPVGPNLGNALGPGATASDDGAYVASDGVWDVAADSRLALDPIDTHDPNYGVGYWFLDHMVVGEATPCAGPCTTRRFYARDRSIIVDDVTDSVGYVALPGDRLAVLDDDLAIYDAVHGELEHSLEVRGPDVSRTREEDPMSGGAISDPLLALPDGRVAAVTRGGGEIDVALVDVVAGTLSRRIRIPVCGWDLKETGTTTTP